MSEENLIETENADEPINAEQLTISLMTDIVMNEDPEILASDFIDNFILREQPETAQILGMLEMPTQSLLEFVKAAMNQAYQAQIAEVEKHGFQYLDGLKAAVKAQMTELAGE